MIQSRRGHSSFLLRTNVGKAILGKEETACVNKLVCLRNWSDLLWMDHRLLAGSGRRPG